MRISLPVHHFPPRYSAGAELYTYRLARWLQAQEHDVEVVAIEDIRRGSPSRIDAQLDVYEGIPVWRLSFDLLRAPQRRLWEFDNELLGEWFERYFLSQRPDIAHFQAGYLIGVAPIFAAIRQHVPVVLTLHDYWYLCPQHTLQRSDGALCATVPDDPLTCAHCRMWSNEPFARLGRLMDSRARSLVEKLPLGVNGELMATRRERLKAALDLVTHVIAPSEFMYSQFEQIIEPRRLTFSRIGIDIDRLQTGMVRGVGKTLRFGYVGQVVRHKGVHFLVRAFKALEPGAKAIELHIWGGVEANPEYAQALRQVANGDSRIIFHGRFEHSRLLDILNNLDYLVVPSIWYENCPLTILESYAAHLPVICSDHGGMAELVNHGQDGLVFRPGDTVDLAKALQSVVNDTQLNLQLQHGARRRLVRDTADEMHQLTGIYELVNAGTHSAVRHV